jgi:hypothetical protein
MRAARATITATLADAVDADAILALLMVTVSVALTRTSVGSTIICTHPQLPRPPSRTFSRHAIGVVDAARADLTLGAHAPGRLPRSAGQCPRTQARHARRPSLRQGLGAKYCGEPTGPRTWLTQTVETLHKNWRRIRRLWASNCGTDTMR